MPTQARPLFYKKTVKTNSVRLGYRERKLLLGFFALASIVAILAATIFLPAATIHLTLRTSPLLVDQELTIAKTQSQAGTVISGAGFFREVAVEGDQMVTSTELVGAKAHGTVQLVNHTNSEQKIKEQSRLVTSDNRLFYMKTATFVPPNSRAAVAVEAAEAGEAGNIKPQRMTFAALPSDAQSVLYAEATQALTGGSGQTVTVVKDVDLAEAKKTAEQQARRQVELEIRKEVEQTNGWKVLDESWNSEVKSFEPNAKIDDRKSKIHYKARVGVHALGYEEKALSALLEKLLTDKLDKEYMLFPGRISHTVTVEKVDWEKNEATIRVRVTHTTIPRFSVDALKDKLAGRSAAEAQDYLKGLAGVKKVTMNLTPFWVRSIPRIQNRITIDLQSELRP